MSTTIGKLLASIGTFFVHIFNGAKNGFEAMPQAQQQEVIQGVNIAQVIKTGYSKGADYIVNEISNVTHVSPDVATTAIIAIAKDSGVNVDSVQAYLDHIADKIHAGITDNHWNNLWESVAKFAASFLSDGKLHWEVLGLGVIQYALQAIIKK